MNRRHFLTLAGVAPFAAACAGGEAGAQGLLTTADLAQTAAPVWQAWKAAYLQNDGRVVDGLQQNASHSESQGYGLFLSTEFGDQDAFRRIFDWTEMNLSIRGDGLLAWRFLPGQANPVPDLNNASDGDLFYAWALVRAANRFNERQHLVRAQQIATALAERCIVASLANAGETVFLPAAQGFVHEDRLVFNPSYIMPLAMREVAMATGVVELAQTAQHAEAMLVRMADSGPVPDWVQVTARGIVPAEGFSTAAGYEAMRVPLYLVWSGLNRHPAVTQMMRVYARTVQPGVPVPTRVDPLSGAVLEASSDAGYRALAALVSCAGAAGSVGSDMPPFDPSQPYYPATLQMFAMIAANQVSPECVPI
ncbi:glycosyl hydrolase family 8 [Pararhodobacter aggregans]|uniref:cellulase n=1 Tax=Pararhodobacter aggregans TaxID=404875 RepID=A0A2T7UXX7_9RHOB|nr:glycosyl hydrolase family 8 [Pararhodobacter aggregans]PTX05117.1 endoglucanase [Pararhodobacter aggregans]PVE49421.1 glycosyl hydrolase family 5 [Pararhodobacter aggregans]